ncbi:MAG: 2-methylcitrate dehydratase PrpD [Parasphingorhabdus sp.]|jgi:2-methylcitrate dehydratase PrpD
MNYQEFIHNLQWRDVPADTQNMVRRCLLDLLGVAASGIQTQLSAVIRHHALSQFGAGAASARILMDGRTCSPVGAALAGGMTIDSIDAHDGYKPVKGHAGCGVLPALLVFWEAEQGEQVSEAELLTGLLIGYEIACRAGASLHDSVCDYHTSGAWVALAAAAIGTRILKLDAERTRHALGIAEYHGPRSQMMRCIDHPTMLKDGSGWGSMAGVSAAYLARDGFTGAPAITMDAPEQAHFWNDLGEVWLIKEQYFKPFPVCRWAQPAAIAALKLQAENEFDVNHITKIRIGTFHESIRLATANPQTTEQAQYSLPFPVAAALIHKRITVKEIEGEGLQDQAVQQLSQSIELYEVDAFNEVFPERRISKLSITLDDGRILESGPIEANGDPEIPLSEPEIDDKFCLFATPVLGPERTRELLQHVRNMGEATDLNDFNRLIYPTS